MLRARTFLIRHRGTTGGVTVSRCNAEWERNLLAYCSNFATSHGYLPVQYV